MNYLIPNYQSATTTLSVGAANQIRLCSICLPLQIQFSRFAINITLEAAGEFFGVGLYSMDWRGGHGLIVRSIPIPTDSTGAIAVSTYLGDTILPAGNYYWAWTCTSVSVIVTAVAGSTEMCNLLNVDSVNKGYWTAEYDSSAGVLPDVLGGLVTETSGDTVLGLLL